MMMTSLHVIYIYIYTYINIRKGSDKTKRNNTDMKNERKNKKKTELVIYFVNRTTCFTKLTNRSKLLSSCFSKKNFTISKQAHGLKELNGI